MNPATKGWYWLAAGVLALGLNGYYQDGGLPWVHSLAQRSGTAMAETRSEAGRFGQLAEIAVGQHVLCDRSGQPDATVVSAAIAPQLQDRMAEIQLRLAEAQQARMQAQLARMQQVMVRRAVERARAGIEHTQLAVFSDPGQVRVVVPRVPRVGVHVPQGPSIEVMPN